MISQAFFHIIYSESLESLESELELLLRSELFLLEDPLLELLLPRLFLAPVPLPTGLRPLETLRPAVPPRFLVFLRLEVLPIKFFSWSESYGRMSYYYWSLMTSYCGILHLHGGQRATWTWTCGLFYARL